MDMVNEMEPAVLQDSLNPTLDANATLRLRCQLLLRHQMHLYCWHMSFALRGTSVRLLGAVATVGGEPRRRSRNLYQKLQRGKSSRKMQRAKAQAT